MSRTRDNSILHRILEGKASRKQNSEQLENYSIRKQNKIRKQLEDPEVIIPKDTESSTEKGVIQTFDKYLRI